MAIMACNIRLLIETMAITGCLLIDTAGCQKLIVEDDSKCIALEVLYQISLPAQSSHAGQQRLDDSDERNEGHSCAGCTQCRTAGTATL